MFNSTLFVEQQYVSSTSNNSCFQCFSTISPECQTISSHRM